MRWVMMVVFLYVLLPAQDSLFGLYRVEQYTLLRDCESVGIYGRFLFSSDSLFFVLPSGEKYFYNSVRFDRYQYVCGTEDIVLVDGKVKVTHNNMGIPEAEVILVRTNENLVLKPAGKPVFLTSNRWAW